MKVARLHWHNLDPEIRLGSAPDEPITLYRGFAPHQLDPEKGMVSSALTMGHPEIVEDVVSASRSGNIGRLIRHIADHAHQFGEQRPTPFVSATPDQYVASRYARNPSEKVATLVVEADRLMTVPLLTYEVVILGSAGVDSITEINDISAGSTAITL